MDARLLDMLHDPGDPHRLVVGHDVDVDLDRILQVAVDQDWPDVGDPRASVMKLRTSSAEWTIRIARPPST